MIEARQLTKVYVETPAVDNISFTVGEGDIMGFLGPNGAGKTTAIRMLTGFLPPTGGTALIGDIDVWDNGREARKMIGYLPENVALYHEMRVIEYLKFRADLEQVSSRQFRDNLEYVAEKCLIEEVLGTIIGSLSKGYRQRVALAGTLIHKPMVLILDEPTVGLDPVQITRIRNLIREIGKECTVLLSTHILPEVELICNRVMIIDRGKILAQDTPDNLRRHFTGDPVISITLKKPEPENIHEKLSSMPGAQKVSVESDRDFEITYHLKAGQGRDLREEIFQLAVKEQWTLLGLHEETMSMEDIFLRLTTEETDRKTHQEVEE